MRRFIGSPLQLIGRDRAGKWLAVALVELQDDVYEVTGARYLEPDETRPEAIRWLVGAGRLA